MVLSRWLGGRRENRSGQCMACRDFARPGKPGGGVSAGVPRRSRLVLVLVQLWFPGVLGLPGVRRQMKLGLSPSVPGLFTPRLARDHRPGDVAMSVTRAATLLRETSVPLKGSPLRVTS